MSVGRLVSSVVALAYLTVGAWFGGTEIVLRVAMFLLLPMAGIWYSRDLGSYTGPIGLRYVSRTSSPPVLALASWILLLMPILAGIIVVLTS